MRRDGINTANGPPLFLFGVIVCGVSMYRDLSLSFFCFAACGTRFFFRLTLTSTPTHPHTPTHGHGRGWMLPSISSFLLFFFVSFVHHSAPVNVPPPFSLDGAAAGCGCARAYVSVCVCCPPFSLVVSPPRLYTSLGSDGRL